MSVLLRRLFNERAVRKGSKLFTPSTTIVDLLSIEADIGRVLIEVPTSVGQSVEIKRIGHAENGAELILTNLGTGEVILDGSDSIQSNQQASRIVIPGKTKLRIARNASVTLKYTIPSSNSFSASSWEVIRQVPAQSEDYIVASIQNLPISGPNDNPRYISIKLPNEGQRTDTQNILRLSTSEVIVERWDRVLRISFRIDFARSSGNANTLVVSISQVVNNKVILNYKDLVESLLNSVLSGVGEPGFSIKVPPSQYEIAVAANLYLSTDSNAGTVNNNYRIPLAAFLTREAIGSPATMKDVVRIWLPRQDGTIENHYGVHIGVGFEVPLAL